jgi:hypothetical protein
MRMSDLHVGQRVVLPEGEVGTVASLDLDADVAWVRVPVPGKPDAADMIDMDPLDLEPAPQEKA